MEKSSNAIKTCWQDILKEASLEKSGVVQQHLFLSLMRPFTIFGGGQPEKGSVILQWLNLVAGDEWTEEGKDKNNIILKIKHCKLRFMINISLHAFLVDYTPIILNLEMHKVKVIYCLALLFFPEECSL